MYVFTAYLHVNVLDRFITLAVIIFVLLEHLVAIYVSSKSVLITLVYHVWDVCPYGIWL